jgi:ribonucleoside-diphosphate reductase alpha chain
MAIPRGKSNRKILKKLIPASEELARQTYYRNGEDFPALCKRVASHVGQTTAYKRHYQDLLQSLQLVPNTPLWYTAGLSTSGANGSACFVIPQVADSIYDKDGWFDALKYNAGITKYGGGVGQDVSLIRETGANVDIHKNVAPGPLGWMEIMNASAEQMRQNFGRRGANMVTIHISHPDVMSFAGCKDVEIQSGTRGPFANINISVRVTDEFMRKAIGEDPDPMFTLVSPYDGVETVMDAREMLKQIAAHACECGDPGLLFWDRATESWCLESLYPLSGVNPCGEQFLEEWGCCNLTAINLPIALLEKQAFGQELDWNNFEYVIRMGVRFLDDVIDAGKFPAVGKIEEHARDTRRIGLGIMGLAQLLAYQEVAYDSEEGRAFVEHVMEFKEAVEMDESAKLAEERGSFPLWESSSLYPDTPRRNAEVSTIAPTGATGVLANCATGGLEPYFALYYIRKVETGQKIEVLAPELERYCKYNKLDTEKVLTHVKEHGSVQNLKSFPDEGKDIFRTAGEMEWESHILMQSACQKYTGNSISKTINMPRGTSPDEVLKAYVMAWKEGCKGITVYVDGSKDLQPLNVATQSELAQLIQTLYNGKSSLDEHRIADILRISTDEVVLQLRKLGIKLKRTNPDKDDPDNKRRIASFVLQKLEGEMLAGARIVGVDDEDKSAAIEIVNYNLNLLSYTDDMLKSDSVRKSRKIYSGQRHGQQTNILRTQSYPALYRMWKRWYKDGQKVLPTKWKPTPTSIRQLFTSYGGRKNGDTYFHTTLNLDDVVDKLIPRLEEAIPGCEFSVKEAGPTDRVFKVYISNPPALFKYIEQAPIETQALDLESYEYSCSRCPACGSTNFVDTGKCKTCWDCGYADGVCSINLTD